MPTRVPVPRRPDYPAPADPRDSEPDPDPSREVDE
jgi:hypothetical protein